MDNIILRLRKIFTDSGETQTCIAEKTGVTSAYIWKILNKDSGSPSDMFIKTVCQAYRISETWLRTGEGDMEALPEDETAAIVAEILDDNSSDFYKAVVEVVKKYQQLDPKSKKVIDQLCSDFIKNKEQS